MLHEEIGHPSSTKLQCSIIREILFAMAIAYIVLSFFLVATSVHSIPLMESVFHDTTLQRKGVSVAHASEVSTEKQPLYELSIPALSLRAPIEGVGQNNLGEMDVPDGSTNTIGWYKYGTAPGDMGSAVLAAHVYAGFKKLNRLEVGDDIFTTDRVGTRLHFRVSAIETYDLADVPAEKLFNDASQRSLNLITCAGTFDKRKNTYTKRLIVYTTLIDNETITD